MTTVYIIQPDDDERKEAIDDLLESLDILYPDELISRHALAITTEVPEVLQLLSKFAQPGPEPATSPARKARRQPRQKTGSNGSGGPEPAHVEDQIAALEAEPDLASSQPAEDALGTAEKNPSTQFYKWRILASGKECNSLSTLMGHRKLHPGDRVMHRTLGLHEVAERSDGSLYLHRLAS